MPLGLPLPYFQRMPLAGSAPNVPGRLVCYGAAVENDSLFNQTATADSAGGVHLVTVQSGLVPRRAVILLRQHGAECWCAAGGLWVESRQRAVRFATNLDALVYCQAVGVRGIVVGFDHAGVTLYELNVDAILDSVSGGTQWFAPDRTSPANGLFWISAS